MCDESGEGSVTDSQVLVMWHLSYADNLVLPSSDEAGSLTPILTQGTCTTFRCA